MATRINYFTNTNPNDLSWDGINTYTVTLSNFFGIYVHGDFYRIMATFSNNYVGPLYVHFIGGTSL